MTHRYNFYRMYKVVVYLEEKRKEIMEFQRTIRAYQRVAKLVRKETQELLPLDQKLFQTDYERRLWAKTISIKSKLIYREDISVLYEGLVELAPLIEKFFGEVFVMVKDDALRHNRLALLQVIESLPKGLADLMALEVKWKEKKK